MKRSAIALAAAGLGVTLVAAGVGLAGPGAAAQDSAYGGGRHAGAGTCTDGATPFCPANSREFSLDAHAAPSGRGASGTLEYAVPETEQILVSGDVTCLRVTGNRAVVGGRITEGPSTGAGFAMRLEDVGRPGASKRDRVSPVYLLFSSEEPPGFPRTCPPFDWDAFGDIGFFTQTFGDVSVHDR